MLPTSFGCFLPPFHHPAADPWHALHDDIELCLLAEELGFDELWIGEHHSGGWATLSSPDLLLAAIARETRRIRLGTGVVPLPLHHPLQVAQRALLLDHLSRGRTMLGCGPGALVQDFEMLGVDPLTARAHFSAALDTVAALLRGELVDVRTPWFTAAEAHLQLRPYRDPVELVCASSLGDAAITELTGVDAAPLVHLAQPWGVVRAGGDNDPVGALADRVATWRARSPRPIRLSVFVHVSDSRAAGVAEVLPGWLDQRLGMYRDTLGMPIPKSEVTNRAALEWLIDTGSYIVGPPDDCAAQLRSLADRLGGLDNVTVFVPGWLPKPAVRQSLTAFAREVVPALRGAHAGVDQAQRTARAQAGRRAEVRAAMAATPVA
ncbi:LLM class flavin-dependent oxidoreductase [Nocardia niigatensis]